MATVSRAFKVKNGLTVEGAELRPAAGTTSYPPILLTSGTNLSTATAGAFEFDGTNFYLTPSTTRKTIAFTDSVLTSSVFLGTTSVPLNRASGSLSLAGVSIDGSAGSVANSITFNTSGGAAAGTTYNGGTARTIDYSTVGAAAASHAHGNITSGGAIGSTANLVVVTGTSGEVTTASAPSSASTQFLRGDLTWVVPTDTNFYPTALTYAGGTTAGPVATIAMSGTTNITADAIPSASGTASGVVTTGAQTFAGVKTMTSPSITTSLTTGSTSFDLVNTTATTVNFAGAGTTVSIGAATGTTTVNNSLVVTGNLTVNGTTTTVNSTTVTVDDIVLELGDVATPSNTTANGGGILLKAGTDVNKTLTWTSTGANWTSSENFDLSSGKVYKINNTSVLSATALGSGVTGSSLTSVGTIGTGVWNGTIIDPTYGGTGVNNGSKTITLGGNLTTSGAFATTLTMTAATSLTLPTNGTLVNIPSSVSGNGTSTALTGGASSGTTGQTGGAVTVTGGASTSGTSTNTGGSVTITGGAANTTAGIGGSVTINGGQGSSANGNGSIVIGTTNTDAVTIGAVNKTMTIGGSGIVNLSGSTTGTTAATFSTVYNSATYNGGEFLIKASNGTNIEINKVLVITNGTDVYITTYGESFVTADLVNIDFTYTSTNVNLVVTPVGGTTGTTNIRVTGTLLAV